MTYITAPPKHPPLSIIFTLHISAPSSSPSSILLPHFGEAPPEKREKIRGERKKPIAHLAGSRSRAKFLVLPRIWSRIFRGALLQFPRIDFFCFVVFSSISQVLHLDFLTVFLYWIFSNRVCRLPPHSRRALQLCMLMFAVEHL